MGFRPSGRDEVTVRGYLLRGELVVSTFHRRARWWYPTEKRKAAEIAHDLGRVLFRWWRVYRDADERGWRYIVRWQDEAGGIYEDRQPTGRAVTVHLAPGVRFGTTAGGSLTMLYGLGCDRRETLGDAEGLGWIRVE